MQEQTRRENPCRLSTQVSPGSRLVSGASASLCIISVSKVVFTIARRTIVSYILWCPIHAKFIYQLLILKRPKSIFPNEKRVFAGRFQFLPNLISHKDTTPPWVRPQDLQAKRSARSMKIGFGRLSRPNPFAPLRLQSNKSIHPALRLASDRPPPRGQLVLLGSICAQSQRSVRTRRARRATLIPLPATPAHTPRCADRSMPEMRALRQSTTTPTADPRQRWRSTSTAMPATPGSRARARPRQLRRTTTRTRPIAPPSPYQTENSQAPAPTD